MGDAIKAFDEAIRIKPDYAEAWYDKGKVLVLLRRHMEAVKAFDEAIRIKPDYAEAWYDKGVSLTGLGMYDTTSFAVIPGEVKVVNKELGGIESFDEAIRIKPDYAEAWYDKGKVLVLLRRHMEAVKAFDEAIRIKPDYAEAWYDKGVSINEAWKYTNLSINDRLEMGDAIKAFDEAIRIKPDYAEAWYFKGSIQLQQISKNPSQQRLYSILKAFDEAIRIKPDYAEAWYDKGMVLVLLRRDDEAVKAFDESSSLNPTGAINIKSNVNHIKKKFGIGLLNKFRKKIF